MSNARAAGSFSSRTIIHSSSTRSLAVIWPLALLSLPAHSRSLTPTSPAAHARLTPAHHLSLTVVGWRGPATATSLRHHYVHFDVLRHGG